MLYTILAGAKRHRIEPWTYVRDLLLRLHADDSRLDDMLPDRWAAAHPEAILSHRLHESRTKAIRTRARRAHRRARAAECRTGGQRPWIYMTHTALMTYWDFLCGVASRRHQPVAANISSTNVGGSGTPVGEGSPPPTAPPPGGHALAEIRPPIGVAL